MIYNMAKQTFLNLRTTSEDIFAANKQGYCHMIAEIFEVKLSQIYL